MSRSWSRVSFIICNGTQSTSFFIPPIIYVTRGMIDESTVGDFFFQCQEPICVLVKRNSRVLRESHYSNSVLRIELRLCKHNLSNIHAMQTEYT